MPSVKIVLKLLCQNVESGHQCQVNLRRSIYEIDSDIEEIKLPLQAIVKLKRIHALQDSHSAAILPMPQRAQLSLPVISKLEPSDERSEKRPLHDARGSRRFGEQGLRDRSISRAHKSKVGETEAKRNPSAEELKEIKALLLEMKGKLLSQSKQNDGSLTDEDRQPEQEEEEERRITTNFVKRLSEGLKEIRASESTNCPFVQYLLTKEDSRQGNIDTSLPISAIIGQNYSLAYKHDTPPEESAGIESMDLVPPKENHSSGSEYPKSTYDGTGTDTSTIKSTMGVFSNAEITKQLENSLQELECSCPENSTSVLDSSRSSEIEKSENQL